MRVVLAAAVAALVTAAPAAALNVDRSVARALHVSSIAQIEAVAKSDKLRSCQAGDRRTHTNTSGPAQTARKAAAVACEQPPRSNPLTPDSLAKATAAALSILG